MARNKTSTAPPEPETTVEPAPAKHVAKTSAAEPTTVSVSAQHLADCLAGFAFALAAFGADMLSSEGRDAFASLVADLDAADGKPPVRYEISAADAFWISNDLMNNRFQRPALTGGEVVLGQTVAQQAPGLARRLSAKAASRPPRRDVFPVPRAPIESVAFAPEPQNRKYPNGQYFDGKGRPTESKPTVRSSW